MSAPTHDNRPESNAFPMAFYAVGGSLRTDCPSYVERRADRELFDALNRHEFCYILTSRQMGKSSLMIRTVDRLRQEGTRAIVLDLTAIGSNLSTEQWYLGLLDHLGEQLGLEEELEDYWQANSDRGPLLRWMGALREVVLDCLSAPLVIFIDEIDVVRSLPFSTDEFFAAIRECYNRRADAEVFRSLTFCLLGVAAPSDLIRDTRLTPFNIGRRIELADFTPEEAAPLAAGLGDGYLESGASELRTPIAQRLLQRILYWTDGHPYLTQRLCAAVAERLASGLQLQVTSHPSLPTLVDAVCSDLFLTSHARERDDNLLFVRERLLRSEVDLVTLLDTYGRVRGGKRVADEESNAVVTALRLSGAVKGERGWLRVRNRIYSTVFDRVWVRENLPYAEIWRQQRAYRRGLMRALAGSSVVLAVMALLAWGAYANAHRADAKSAEARAETAKARRLLYGANMNLIQSAWDNNEMSQMEALLQETQSYQERGFEWYYWQRMCHRDLFTLRLRDSWHVITSVAFSADGKRVVTGSVGGSAIIWDAVSGRELLQLKAPDSWVNSVAFSVDGTRVVTGHRDGTAKVWDAVSGYELHTLKGHSASVNCVAFSADGKRIIIGSDDQTVKVWDAMSGRDLRTLRFYHRAITGGWAITGTAYSIAFSPDGKRIVTVSWDHTATVWDAASGRELVTLKGHNAPVKCVGFSPDSKRIATGSDDGTVKTWDAASGREQVTLKGHNAPVTCVVFSADGKRIVTGSRDWTAKEWDAVSGRELLPLKGHNAPVTCVAFSPDGRRIITGARDTAKMWDADSDGELVIPNGPSRRRVSCVAFTADGKQIVTGSDDMTETGPSPFKVATVWDAVSGRSLVTLKGDNDVVRSVTFSADGERIVLGMASAVAEIWDVRTRRKLHELKHNSYVTAALSADGKRIVTGSGDGTVKMWDAASGRELLPLKGHNAPVNSVAFSPDGKRIATGAGGNDGMKVWDAVNGHELRTLKLPFGGSVDSVAFSPDGKRIVAGGGNGITEGYLPGIVIVWDAVSGRQLLTLNGHADQVTSVAFSPDGKRIVTGSADKTVKVWDAMSGRELLTLRGHTGYVRSVAVSQDGKRVVTGSDDGTCRVWEAATPEQSEAWEKVEDHR